MITQGWIGIDLDGTLAVYDGWKGAQHIGEPIPAMVERVKQWLSEGLAVRIFTARVWHDGNPERHLEAKIAEEAIHDWCVKVFGHALPITCTKDYGMIVLYDDRCVQVEANTGRLIGQ
jgi:hypothetical protein